MTEALYNKRLEMPYWELDKKIAIAALSFYQAAISPLLKNILGVSSFCRFSPTCSEYAKISIKEKGVLRGSLLAIRRLSNCHPFGK